MMHQQRFTLVTVPGEVYTFISPNAEDICGLVMMFIDGLTKRSKYAIAQQDYNGDTFLNFKKGDLIVLLQENGENLKNSELCYGECVRTTKKGNFPSESVYVLPTITKPPPEILVSSCLTAQFFPITLFFLKAIAVN
ncbi:myosin-VIIa-like [Mercenaria mercenaria]|uniref:myosin-VIIa-like n=1 Tax=Mercenaria mercenaria TaxID=6596 RepID=UPI00234F2E3B|nr:myosin-VIIa-like [Mercenaria mercenaria]